MEGRDVGVGGGGLHAEGGEEDELADGGGEAGEEGVEGLWMKKFHMC